MHCCAQNIRSRIVIEGSGTYRRFGVAASAERSVSKSTKEYPMAKKAAAKKRAKTKPAKAKKK